MRLDDSNIEDVLIGAIQEKAALDRMEALDRQMDAKALTARRRRNRIASIAAACVVLVACGDIGLKLHTRSVGYGYDMTEFSINRGGSAIEASIENRLFKDALEDIESQRESILREMDNPSYDDPDYVDQLANDLEELSFTQAICHLRQGKYFKARKELKEIARGSGAFSSKAQDLLDNML